jgi:hypothetical protein
MDKISTTVFNHHRSHFSLHTLDDQSLWETEVVSRKTKNDEK